MYQINVVTKTKGWFWKKEKYNVYQVVKVISACDLGTYYYPEEHLLVSEHVDLKDADAHLKQLIQFNVK